MSYDTQRVKNIGHRKYRKSVIIIQILQIIYRVGKKIEELSFRREDGLIVQFLACILVIKIWTYLSNSDIKKYSISYVRLMCIFLKNTIQHKKWLKLFFGLLYKIELDKDLI